MFSVEWTFTVRWEVTDTDAAAPAARPVRPGAFKGKQPKLNGQQRVRLVRLDREVTKTPTELLGVSRAIIYRELKKAREAAA